MLLIDKLFWYSFFLIAMGKMLAHDTTPYTGSTSPKYVYFKKLGLESVFLILSCFLLALISERSAFLFRLLCAAVTAYNYHILIGLGCRKRTMSRYANLLTLILVIFTADHILLLGGILICRLIFLRNTLHNEYLAAVEKRNCASAVCTEVQDVPMQETARPQHHTAYFHDEAEAQCQEEDAQWSNWTDQEEDWDWNNWMEQEEPISQEEEDDYYYSTEVGEEDDSWGYADNPSTLDFAGTDWNSYDYSNNAEVAATVLDMLY